MSYEPPGPTAQYKALGAVLFVTGLALGLLGLNRRERVECVQGPCDVTEPNPDYVLVGIGVVLLVLGAATLLEGFYSRR